MEKQRWKSQRREEKKREDQRRERVRRKKTQVRDSLCFSNDLWLRRSKSKLAKAVGAEPCGQMRDETLQHISRSKCTRIGRLFARCCGAKHIWKSKCRKHTRFGPLLVVEMSKKSRRCGAKHISKSKV